MRCIDSDRALTARTRLCLLVTDRRLAYSGGVIPPHDPDSGNLPSGIHAATWTEIVERFGSNTHRQRLLMGLERALRALRLFGCRRFYLDGSFVTSKVLPGDWDGCWEAEGVDIARLALHEPLLWDDVIGRPSQKRMWGGDLFPVRVAGTTFDRGIFDGFQRDKVTDAPKGIIMLDLDTLP